MALAHSAVVPEAAAALRRLPLLTLYLSERCNSRCVSCDYWRTGRADLTLDAVTRLLPDLERLETREVLISGGEPLVNPEWPAIAQLLREHGLALWLLTSGLSLAKHATKVVQLFRAVTVSLDGADAETYRAIRGVDAFENVCAGIRAVAAARVPVGVRVTVQRANYRQMPALVALARQLGAAQISFLAADVSNPHAFGRETGGVADVALQVDDLPILERILDALERDRANDLDSAFIAERPQKLRRIFEYYRALLGLGEYPPVRCNAPEFSAVVTPDGRIDPCFFIRGPARDMSLPFDAALNDPALTMLRADVRGKRRPQCRTCVCSMWREPDDQAARDAAIFRLV